ncbi:DNA-binding protein [Salipiger bermudensis]|uniref:DNA-binding protein n=1 Tax=Salipiger bermudensis TaxID=344736 RepID=UPI001CD26D61|nr:DNA-binding protein [Salipiger bermudensis]MCA0961150.1 DNA-binding protein [Salipiger bermudensis]
MEKKQFKLNLPADVKAWLAEQAKNNLRSQSQEVVLALREKMTAQEIVAQK